MKRREHIIEIEELVLMGSPRKALIEAAIQGALREAGIAHKVGERSARALVQEVSRSVGNAVKEVGG